MNLSQFIYDVDKICRNDISRNVLVSERDYITQLNCLIRYPDGISQPSNYKVHSQTLPGGIEQKMGCDSIMIFRFSSGYKIGFFEAKYPRYKSVNRNISHKQWDYDNHFNEQLDKQNEYKRVFPQLIFWELFIDNGVLGNVKSPFVDGLGSSLILLEHILPFRPSSKWKLPTLKNALSAFGLNFEKLIRQIMDCELGSLVRSTENNQITITSLSKSKEELKLEIPILGGDNQNEINEFLIEFGLSSYAIFDLRNE